jgi:hypothetical protein
MTSSQALLVHRAITCYLTACVPSAMAATNDVCHIGDDMDTLTMMNDDVVMRASSPNDARYQRDVS